MKTLHDEAERRRCAVCHSESGAIGALCDDARNTINKDVNGGEFVKMRAQSERE